MTFLTVVIGKKNGILGFKVLLAKYKPYYIMMDKVRWSRKPVKKTCLHSGQITH